MSRRALLLSLAALAALPACDKGSSGTTFRLAQPSAITVARAFGSRHTGLWPYAFVANTAHDELITFDAVEDKVVSSPILLRPLSIPVLDPRPALVASAAFRPPTATGDADNRRPDLVVAVSAGSSQLQLIRTWKDAGGARDPGLAPDAPVELGGQVLALVATPAVGAGGAVVQDRVRVIAALIGGRLAMVEYVWEGDAETGRPAVAEEDGVVVKVEDVGFEALSLAVDPRNPRYLFAASLDDITPGVQGVAQLDMGRTVGEWGPPTALDARGPTRLVAALTLQERVAGAAGAYDQLSSPDGPADNAAAFEASAVQRVYAWREPSSCGPTTPLPCGIVVLDTATHQLAAPAFLGGQAPFPITVPSRPVALIAARPPLHPPSPADTAPQTTESADFMRIFVKDARVTTGVLGIPCEDGRIYVADLARWEVPSAEYEVNGSDTGTGVSRFTPSLTTSRRPGFYEPKNIADGDTANQSSQRSRWLADTGAAAYVQTTPGFTPTDTWTVTYQGYLPAFATSRVADVEEVTGVPGRLRVSFQARTPGSGPVTQVVNVYDPALGVHVGDVVEVWTGTTPFDPLQPEVRICPDTTTTGEDDENVPPIEGRVVSVEPPDELHPGGSLLVEQPPGDCVSIVDGRATICDGETRGPWTSRGRCWASLPQIDGKELNGSQTRASLQVRIRGGGGTPGNEEFVVAGAVTGYVGRAVARPGADVAASLPLATHDFVLPSQLPGQDEATLVAACPLIPYPLAWSDARGVACDAACRATCEAAAIARRVRRTHLTSLACHAPSGGRTHCEIRYPQFVRPEDPAAAFPPPVGPALAFSIGLQCKKATATAVTGCTSGQDVLSERDLVRDARVTFATRSGWSPAVRFGGGANGGAPTLPTGGVYFDRTGDTAAEAARWDRPTDRYRFFVPYVGNVVLDVSPGQTNGETKVLR